MSNELTDRTAIVKREFPNILKKHLGIIKTACEAAGIHRSTYYDWCEKDPEFHKACNEAYEERLDFVESKLLKNIEDHDTTAIIFYLKTKGKNRGYVERIEQTGADGGAIKNEHTVKRDPNDQAIIDEYYTRRKSNEIKQIINETEDINEAKTYIN